MSKMVSYLPQEYVDQAFVLGERSYYLQAPDRFKKINSIEAVKSFIFNESIRPKYPEKYLSILD